MISNFSNPKVNIENRLPDIITITFDWVLYVLPLTTAANLVKLKENPVNLLLVKNNPKICPSSWITIPKTTKEIKINTLNPVPNKSFLKPIFWMFNH